MFGPSHPRRDAYGTMTSADFYKPNPVSLRELSFPKKKKKKNRNADQFADLPG